jgi:hypothetical protein
MSLFLSLPLSHMSMSGCLHLPVYDCRSTYHHSQCLLNDLWPNIMSERFSTNLWTPWTLPTLLPAWLHFGPTKYQHIHIHISIIHQLNYTHSLITYPLNNPPTSSLLFHVPSLLPSIPNYLSCTNP